MVPAVRTWQQRELFTRSFLRDFDGIRRILKSVLHIAINI
jgi:hypothetical protein